MLRLPRKRSRRPHYSIVAGLPRTSLEVLRVLHLPRKMRPRCSKCCACHAKWHWGAEGAAPATQTQPASTLLNRRRTSADLWGLWLTPFSIKPLATQIKRIPVGQHVAGSSNLFFLLAGHGLHPYFVAGFGAYHFLANVVRHYPRPWPNSSARGTWLGTVRQWLLGLQWQEQGAWVWTHPNINFRVDWTQPITGDTKNKEHHALREAWRREQFALWQSSGRRDANAAKGCNYNEKRVACARKMFRSCNTHSRACMIGAIVSDAVLTKLGTQTSLPTHVLGVLVVMRPHGIT